MPDVTACFGTFFDFIAFFWIFSYTFDEHSCLKYCIFTKVSQIVCIINVHFLVCQHAKYDSSLWNVLWEFKHYTFIKLLQLCVKVEV